MTTIRLLSTALIAVAMLSTPAAAHQNAMAGRHVALNGNASASAYSTDGGWIYGHTRITWESNAAAPQNQPGGICDHGDTPAVC